ncbi:hypothetical protein A3Q56_07232 [Intoshia linei]|uniref:Uncharacterized protein n=1 Tax=Intoshia linei TaxID=1819745 RepID=A0A177ASS8_9BILA|nr:hypothetical protein A3Q56_07232 [Intoshia linei]
MKKRRRNKIKNYKDYIENVNEKERKKCERFKKLVSLSKESNKSLNKKIKEEFSNVKYRDDLKGSKVPCKPLQKFKRMNHEINDKVYYQRITSETVKIIQEIKQEVLVEKVAEMANEKEIRMKKKRLQKKLIASKQDDQDKFNPTQSFTYKQFKTDKIEFGDIVHEPPKFRKKM